MRRRGIVLFITLGMMLLLSTIVMLFLRQSGAVQTSLRQDATLIQTGLLLQNMGDYLKSFNLGAEDLFYAADIPSAMHLGPIEATLTLQSAQNRVNINALLKTLQKDQRALDNFIEWMRRQKVRRPGVMLALLTDTMDKDLYPRAQATEIKAYMPQFQNGTIPNRRSLATVLHTYRLISGDASQTVQAWDEIFGYEGNTIDLNYATYTQLTLLFPDWPADTLRRIAAHDNYYSDVGDLPISENLKAAALLPRYGITPVFKTSIMRVSVRLKTPTDCSTTLTFRMHLKNRKIYRLGYTPIECE